jgi:hypothetical protein
VPQAADVPDDDLLVTGLDEACVTHSAKRLVHRGVRGSHEFADLFLGELDVDGDALLVWASVSGGELVEHMREPDPHGVAAEIDTVLRGHPQLLADRAAQGQRGLGVAAEESLEIRAPDDAHPGRAAGSYRSRTRLLVNCGELADDIPGDADGEQWFAAVLGSPDDLGNCRPEQDDMRRSLPLAKQNPRRRVFDDGSDIKQRKAR